jgi:hypothetical protein
MKLTFLVLAVVLTLTCLPQPATTHAEQKPEELAQAAAQSWLALTDAGKYGESWEQASSAFRGAVSKSQWVDAIANARTPLGKMQSRKLTGTQYIKDPPNAPAGEYVVIRYATDFENKKDAVETISPMLDKDGKWRVSGYYIK